MHERNNNGLKRMEFYLEGKTRHKEIHTKEDCEGWKNRKDCQTNSS